MTAENPRIAIASPGVGRVQRGYERLFDDLFRLMRGRFDVMLLKGGGPRTPDERVVPFLHRNGAALRALPYRLLGNRTPYHAECLLYALGMLPLLRGGRFDVVHTIDPPLTRLLFRLRARLGLRFTLLHTEGAGMVPSNYPPADHTQHIAQVLMDGSVAHGHDPAGMTLLPCGFHPGRFAVSADRAALRRAHGIGPDTFVVLAVAAINRWQKRTDYLVEEVAKLDGDVLLLLDGSLDHGDPTLVEEARAKLGSRVRIGHVPSEKVGELFALADVMAHASRFESFGLAIVEAASTGLPVLIDDGPHFRWLLPNPGCWVRMEEPGALAARLEACRRDPAALAAARCPPAMVQDRFSWDALAPGYEAMYRRVATLPRTGRPEAECRLPPGRLAA